MRIKVVFQILVLSASSLQLLNGATTKRKPGASPYTPAYQSHLRSCKSFTDLVQLVEAAQKNLQSLHAAIPDNNTSSEARKPHLTHRAKLWISKIYKHLPRATKHCRLPRPLDSILEEQVNVSYKGLTHPKGDSYVQVARAGLRKHFTGNVSDSCHSSKRDKKKCVMALAEVLLVMAFRGGEAGSREGEAQTIPEAEVLGLLLEILRLGRLEKHRTKHPHRKDLRKSIGVPAAGLKKTIVAEVDTSAVLREVPATFLSVTFRPRVIQHGWMTFNTSSPVLRVMLRALSPALFRMGGSSANFVTYDPTVQEPSFPPSDALGDGPAGQLPSDDPTEHPRMGTHFHNSVKNFTISAGDWTQLLDFIEAVGMQLLLDLNQFYRDEDGGWDPSNALLIMKDVAARGAHVMWQLGNEPNAYYNHYNFSISGQQAAQDFARLQRKLESHFPLEQDRVLVGPDVMKPRNSPQQGASSPVHGLLASPGLASDSMEYLREFLQHLKIKLTAVSWHQYYLNADKADVEDFLSPDTLDRLVWQTASVAAIRDELAPDTPIWLTESGAATGSNNPGGTTAFVRGGAPGFTDAFVGGFLWMDKLGVAAREGVDIVARQTLYNGNLAMFDEDLFPNPDYWLSVLYKRLVGGRVLDLSLSHAPSTTRLYAHCQKNFTRDYTPGSVVVFGMNLANETTEVYFSDDLALSKIFEYLLQAPDGDLHSRYVLLNGWQLEMTSEGFLPDLQPISVSPGYLRLPPTSMGFWVLPDAHAQACM
ncbi:heparanase-like [Panulirus ornatus]|uniref:heparanase-like n=1 Tax=Panulirus ornatus TaxID=150431 RepID=UPI003A839083